MLNKYSKAGVQVQFLINPKLKEKVLESLAAVLPITGIVLFISIFLVPMDLGSVFMFLVGAMLLIFGMGFFQLGAEMAMTCIPRSSAVPQKRMQAKSIGIWFVMTISTSWVITALSPASIMPSIILSTSSLVIRS